MRRLLLALALAVSVACASMPAKQRSLGTLQSVAAALGTFQDFERANHAALGLDTPADAALLKTCPASVVVLPPAATKHQVISCLLAQAFQSELNANVALQAWKAGDPSPGVLGDLRTQVDLLLTIARGVTSSSPATQTFLTNAQAAADAVLSIVASLGGQ